MRSGSGRIYSKSALKDQNNCLSEITNNIYTKSQVGSDKADRVTQLDSCSSKSNSQVHQIKFPEQQQYHEIADEPKGTTDDPTGIVRKLSCLNSIFKELKMLKESEESFEIVRSLSRIEDKFIGIERQILKSTHLQDRN